MQNHVVTLHSGLDGLFLKACSRHSTVRRVYYQSNYKKHPTSISMKSVKIRYLLATLALLAGSNSMGETVLVTQLNEGSGSCGNTLHILTVYQQGSDVIVTKHVEELNVICAAVVSVNRLQATLEMDYPSIALREVDIFNIKNAKSQVLYRNGVVENAYNPDWGDGWVDTRAAGYVNIKQYPWIYHPELGWLRVTEGDIVFSNRDQLNTPTTPRALSFYLYSPNYGWLWTTEFNEKYYSFAAGGYKTVEEITGG